MMRKNILLIAPYIHDFAAFDLWMKPLGLLYTASAAQAAGYDVRLINCLDRLHPAAMALGRRHQTKSTGDGRGKFSFEEIPKPTPLEAIPRAYKRYGIPVKAFRDELRGGPRPDAIGVGSMMTYWYPGVAETIQMARGDFPEAPVILGGAYATLCPAHAREHSGADYVVEGAGERQLPEVLQKIIGPGEPETNGGSLRPAYHLLPRVDSVSMLTSRGCPFSCAYCASSLLSGGFTQRPVDEVVGEIVSYAERLKIRDIAFYDDALLVNSDNHIKPILRELINRKLSLRLHTPNGLHANLVDQELARLMKLAGFSTIRLSVESIDRSRMRDSCMKVSIEGFKRSVAHLSAAGFERGSLAAYVLLGVPGQQPHEVEETMEFVHEQGVMVRLADFSPIPGTTYFPLASEWFGLDLNEPLLQNSSVLPHFAPALLDCYRRLKSLARSLNETILSPR